MARTRRIKTMELGVADYHLMSRTNDRRFLFEKGAIKTMLADSLRRAAEFSGVRLRAYTVMGNHFHVVVRVTRTEEPVPEAELIRRVGVLKGAKAAEELSNHWQELAAAGFLAALEEEQNRLRERMNDVSAFIKTFKEEFNRLYKRDREYCGSIWSGRFKSTLIEDGRYLATCIKYVLYNPIRAGMVRQVKEYQWSWSENDVENEDFAGTVPREWYLRRRAQIGEGKIFGSEGFVRGKAFQLGDRFPAKTVAAHAVGGVVCATQGGEGMYATHGWRLGA